MAMNTPPTHSIEIAYPDELLQELDEQQLTRLASEAFYVRLYAEGKISSGHAGAMLGLTRSAFLDLLGHYGVSYFDEQTDLAEDMRAASTTGEQ